MFVLGRNVQKYSPRVGVPPAKLIKMILKEQERRRKYAQGEEPQLAANQKQDEPKRDEQEEMMKAKEIQLNKERFEYEQVIEATEGVGNLPEGWTDVSSEDPSLFQANDKAKPYRPSIMRPHFCTNLQLHSSLPAFRMKSREEEIARNSFLGWRDIFRAGSSVSFDPN